MNKKGQFNIIGLAIIGVIALILLALFYFSDSFRYISIGAGLMIMGFIVLFKSGIKNDRTKIGIFVGLLAVGFIIIFSSGVLNTITSVSKVTEVGGQPFWLANGIANSVDDGFQFNFKGTDYRLKDGSGTYEPKKAVTVFINKKNSGCNYKLETVEKKGGFLGLQTLTYKTLNNPSRYANTEVSISGGNNPVVMNAFNDRQTIGEAYGDGEITVETLGLIGSEKDCPEASNIALLGERFVFKNELDNFISDSDSINIFSLVADARNIKDANTFTNEFNDGTLKIISNQVTGEKDIGSVEYTLEANAEIFDSVFVIADEVANPEINKVNFPSNINAGDSANLVVELSSDVEGRVVTTVKSDEFSISPSSKIISLDGTKTISFNLAAEDSTGSYSIDVEACASSQFSTKKNCDSYTKTGKIISKEIKTERCGDGICQSFESYQSCQADCKKIIIPNKTLDCEWYQEPYTKTEIDYGTGYWRAYTPFIEPITTETQDCRNAGWINILAIAMIVVILGSYAIYVTTRKSKGKKK